MGHANHGDLQRSKRSVDIARGIHCDGCCQKHMGEGGNRAVWRYPTNGAAATLPIKQLGFAVALDRERQSSVGKNEKMEVMYRYLSGAEFRQRIEGEEFFSSG